MLLCLLATTPAHADQEPILLEYSADPGCPSGAEFERMVFERAHSARPAADQEPARLFTVTIHNANQGVQGSLTVRERGVSLVRQLRGKNCRQLASVLALAAALAIDPAADLASSVEGEADDAEDISSLSEPEPAPQTTTAPPSGPTDSVSNKPETRPVEATPLQSAPDEDRVSDAYEPRGPSGLYGEFGLGPRFEIGATPYPALGPHVTLGLLSANGRWRAQLGGSWLMTPEKQVGGATAAFRVLAANLSLCALALQWRDHITGGPCVHAEVGDVLGRGTNIDYQSTVHRLWTTAGAHIHVRIPRDDVWFFAADIGANVLLNRYKFEFNEPDTEVFNQSAVTGSVNLILGALF